MKKYISLLALFLLPAIASAGSFFDGSIFGVTAISQNADLEVSSPGSATLTSSESGTGFGIYLDKYYKKKYRLNGTWSYVGYDNFDISELTVAADYLIPLNSDITFFGGVAAGGALQKFSDAGVGDSALGLVYGVQLGGIAYLNKHLMLELGYRFRPANVETEVESLTDTIITVTDLSETYLSLLLMF